MAEQKTAFWGEPFLVLSRFSFYLKQHQVPIVQVPNQPAQELPTSSEASNWMLTVV